MLDIVRIRINHLEKPRGIQGSIQFQWEIVTDHTNVTQTAFRIQIAEDRDYRRLVYDSEKTESRQSANVEVGGIAWKTLTHYYARARVWDNYGEASPWRETEFLSALGDPEEWRADFITAETEEDRAKAPGTMVRKEFTLQKPVREALLLCSAHGMYQAFLNGARVGDHELAPGWTSYQKRLLYQTYDVTSLLRPGKNALGALVGAGWYKGDITYLRIHNCYGDFAAFGGQLLIRYEDGGEETIVTDRAWKGCHSPILHADLFDGETYDARLEQPGWLEADFGERGWEPVCVVPQKKEALVPQRGCAVRIKERKPAKSLFRTPQKDLVLDFGQNLSGWLRFRVEGNPGDVVELNFFETLDSEGNVYLANLRTAKQTVRYTCKGGGMEEFQPHFTFHGFRYARVRQYPGAVKKENFEALVLYSDMEEKGGFHCSHPLLNQLQSNITWGMKGNFLDIPTDCPQRDERLGWTGDAQIFGRTASFLMDTTEFYRKWLCDVKADQKPDGGVPNVVPDVLPNFDENPAYGSSAWGDVAVILPWTLYQETGDLSIIRQQYGSMKAWVDFLTANAASEAEIFPMQFGDWVALDAEEGSYYGATPVKLTCFGYYAYVSGLFAKMAEAVGEREDGARYRALREQVAEEFRKRYVTPDGAMAVKTQTAHIVALYFDLLREDQKEKILEGLLSLLAQKEGHLTTGFIGTPYFLHALSQNGRLEEAYDLLLKEDFPSWLYQVKKGATTVWEHWDGLKPDGTMWSPDMNSFNHYAYGSVGQWLYEVCGGLRVDEAHPGYSHFLVEPQPGGGLTYAEVFHRASYGEIRVRWERTETETIYDIQIPPNTTASIHLRHVARIIDPAALNFDQKGTHAYAQAGSGRYRIRTVNENTI